MYYIISLCRGEDSNLHELLCSQLFESCASTIPPPRQDIILVYSRQAGLSDSKTRKTRQLSLEHYARLQKLSLQRLRAGHLGIHGIIPHLSVYAPSNKNEFDRPET